MLITDAQTLNILACPACKKSLSPNDELRFGCRNESCHLHDDIFVTASGKLVLVDFLNSILDRDNLAKSNAVSLIERSRWRALLSRAADGSNRIAPYFAHDMIRRLEESGDVNGRKPVVLIVGGGTVGNGSAGLYASDKVDVVSFDIYASDNVTFVADGHAIPIADHSVDAVWVQAVLEHVADPPEVVSEIHRILKPGGLLFADTPFLWPVHEKAYDYTRYTPSGHRWLFKQFDVLAAGTSSGPGTNFVLALRYLAASLFRSSKVGHLVALPFFWVRLLDDLCDLRRGLDAAAGLFFFGQKNNTTLSHQGLVAFYDEQIDLQSLVPGFRRARKALSPN